MSCSSSDDCSPEITLEVGDRVFLSSVDGGDVLPEFSSVSPPGFAIFATAGPLVLALGDVLGDVFPLVVGLSVLVLAGSGGGDLGLDSGFALDEEGFFASGTGVLPFFVVEGDAFG